MRGRVGQSKSARIAALAPRLASTRQCFSWPMLTGGCVPRSYFGVDVKAYGQYGHVDSSALKVTNLKIQVYPPNTRMTPRRAGWLARLSNPVRQGAMLPASCSGFCEVEERV
jgi:hypothetical protein